MDTTCATANNRGCCRKLSNGVKYCGYKGTCGYAASQGNSLDYCSAKQTSSFASLGDHNACRNPDSDSGELWCYVADNQWEYCEPFGTPPLLALHANICVASWMDFCCRIGRIVAHA